MKVAVISYSSTGKNEELAVSVSKKLKADHIKIEEIKQRKMGTTFADILLPRCPQVKPDPDVIDKYDFVILFAPIWIGKAASPLRSYLKYIKHHPKKYAFISFSGGSLGRNPGVLKEVTKKTKKEPDMFLQLYIVDLIDKPKVTSQETLDYKFNSKDKEKLTAEILEKLKSVINK